MKQQTNTIMTNTTLTTEQQRMFESLVMLGDSEELALKTALEQKENDSEMYYQAYNL